MALMMLMLREYACAGKIYRCSPDIYFDIAGGPPHLASCCFSNRRRPRIDDAHYIPHFKFPAERHVLLCVGYIARRGRN